MNDDQDAYGQEVYDYLQGEKGCEIVERDDGFFDAASGPLAYFAGYRQWPSHYKKAMRYVRGRVLDIGCGAGRHALYLQEQGCEVVGIDISPLAIEVCRRRGLKDARVLSITQVSPKLGQFDTLLMLGNNFGLMGNSTRAKWLLKRFHRTTTPRARIIAESTDPYQTTEPFHLDYHDRNRRRGRLPGQVRIRVKYKKYVTPWFDYVFVSRDEMQQILDSTGWRVEKFIDSSAAQYIAVVEKTGA